MVIVIILVVPILYDLLEFRRRADRIRRMLAHQSAAVRSGKLNNTP
jgi:hypothetical protein